MLGRMSKAVRKLVWLRYRKLILTVVVVAVVVLAWMKWG
jgi:hypothetical protein